jgi:cytochrome c556
MTAACWLCLAAVVGLLVLASWQRYQTEEEACRKAFFKEMYESEQRIGRLRQERLDIMEGQLAQARERLKSVAEASRDLAAQAEEQS